MRGLLAGCGSGVLVGDDTSRRNVLGEKILYPEGSVATSPRRLVVAIQVVYEDEAMQEVRIREELFWWEWLDTYSTIESKGVDAVGVYKVLTPKSLIGVEIQPFKMVT